MQYGEIIKISQFHEPFRNIVCNKKLPVCMQYTYSTSTSHVNTYRKWYSMKLLIVHVYMTNEVYI